MRSGAAHRLGLAALAALAAASGLAGGALGQPAGGFGASPLSTATADLSLEDATKQALIAEHLAERARLPADQRATLDAFAAAVLGRLNANPPSGDALAAAVAIVRELAPTLTALEAEAIGAYSLLDATRQMQETQMSFSLQYLMLQSQMSAENREDSMVSNIMQTKHETMRNSIRNVR